MIKIKQIQSDSFTYQQILNDDQIRSRFINELEEYRNSWYEIEQNYHVGFLLKIKDFGG